MNRQFIRKKITCEGKSHREQHTNLKFFSQLSVYIIFEGVKFGFFFCVACEGSRFGGCAFFLPMVFTVSPYQICDGLV